METQEKIDKIIEHARAIAALASDQNIEESPNPAKAESPFEVIPVKEVSRIIFTKMEYEFNDEKTMVNFIVSRMRLRGYVLYRFEEGTRLYSVTSLGASASWLVVPEEARKDPAYEFKSSSLWFKTNEIPAMLSDLWISKKPAFDKEFEGYKEFCIKMRHQ